MDRYIITEEKITINSIFDIIDKNKKIDLSENIKNKISSSRDYLDKKISNSNKLFYGINTGFGSLCNQNISKSKLSKLQENLILSHACGTGKKTPKIIVKIMMILKIKSLSHGNSGIKLDTIQRLVDMYNNNIIPVIYNEGSLGASGDLVPLAHLSLPLIGLGDVYYNESIISSEKFLTIFDWDKINLKSKEGLALINGTQFISAFGVWILIQSKKISYFFDLVSSISIDAFDCSLEPFDDDIQRIRPHNGQLLTATRIKSFFQGINILKRKKNYVQDPYSFRCIPQVHGASKDVITHVSEIFTKEINSVTDNPNIFVQKDKIISGGNFHAQPLAMALDYLSIAMHELGNISERRIFQLISGKRGLPEYLIINSGINSGLMIPQYTAASLVSKNKMLCTPCSIDSIVTSNGQEDHVSMGANSAVKLFEIINNLEKILSIELLTSAQALEIRKRKISNFHESFIESYRKHCKFLDNDRNLFDDIHASIRFYKGYQLDINII